MSDKQTVFPFRTKRAERRRHSNDDLIGRSYEEDFSTVTVVGICPHDDRRVTLRRHPGGNTFSMPAWLMRLIFIDKKKRRHAA